MVGKRKTSLIWRLVGFDSDIPCSIYPDEGEENSVIG
jgi:hypothetical protein